MNNLPIIASKVIEKFDNMAVNSGAIVLESLTKQDLNELVKNIILNFAPLLRYDQDEEDYQRDLSDDNPIVIVCTKIQRDYLQILLKKANIPKGVVVPVSKPSSASEATRVIFGSWGEFIAPLARSTWKNGARHFSDLHELSYIIFNIADAGSGAMKNLASLRVKRMFINAKAVDESDKKRKAAPKITEDYIARWMEATNIDIFVGGAESNYNSDSDSDDETYTSPLPYNTQKQNSKKRKRESGIPQQRCMETSIEQNFNLIQPQASTSLQDDDDEYDSVLNLSPNDFDMDDFMSGGDSNQNEFLGSFTDAFNLLAVPLNVDHLSDSPRYQSTNCPINIEIPANQIATPDFDATPVCGPDPSTKNFVVSQPTFTPLEKEFAVPSTSSPSTASPTGSVSNNVITPPFYSRPVVNGFITVRGTKTEVNCSSITRNWTLAQCKTPFKLNGVEFIH
jgi:hypothetical protein